MAGLWYEQRQKRYTCSLERRHAETTLLDGSLFSLPPLACKDDHCKELQLSENLFAFCAKGCSGGFCLPLLTNVCTHAVCRVEKFWFQGLV